MNGKEEFGEYICEASNELGKKVAVHKVTEIRPIPPKPEFINAPANVDVGPNFKLQWKVPNESPLIRFEVVVEERDHDQSEVKFRHYDHRNYTLSNGLPKGKPYVGSHQFENLKPNNVYRVVVRAVNSYSRDSSNEISFSVGTYGVFNFIRDALC